MNKRDDRIDDEMAYIFNDYLTDVEDLESAFITEEDIVKMILVEYHALGLSIDEISKAWGYTKQEILDLIKNNLLVFQKLLTFLAFPQKYPFQSPSFFFLPPFSKSLLVLLHF